MKSRSKLKFNSDNSKTLMGTTVNFYRLTAKGLIITFTHKGNRGKLFADPCQTCTLLEDRGYIYHFILKNNLPIVYSETSWAYPGFDGEPVEEECLQDETWMEFVKRFSLELNDRIALELVKRFIQLQEIKQWEDEMKEKMLSIPTLIRHINHSA